MNLFGGRGSFMHFHKQLGEAELHKTCSGERGCCMLENFIGIICSIRRLHTNWKQLYMCRHCANTMTASDREHHIIYYIYKQRNYQSLSTPMGYGYVQGTGPSSRFTEARAWYPLPRLSSQVSRRAKTRAAARPLLLAVGPLDDDDGALAVVHAVVADAP